MKITFEGKTFHDIADEMESLLALVTKKISQGMSEKPKSSALPTAAPVAKAQGPGPEAAPVKPPVDKAVDKPVDKPVEKTKARTPKQLENDERLRARAQAKKDTGFKKTPPVQPELPEDAAPFKEVDPAEVVKIRQKTIEDLQTAYANGQQKEVFELLSRFGNGAKSFRELPPDAFVPIREAIDNGALT